MLKRRFLVLVALLSLLLLFSGTEQRTSADGYCSCAMTCAGGSRTCELTCEGNSAADIERAARACCKAADQSTPFSCTGG